METATITADLCGSSHQIVVSKCCEVAQMKAKHEHNGCTTHLKTMQIITKSARPVSRNLIENAAITADSCGSGA